LRVGPHRSLDLGARPVVAGLGGSGFGGLRRGARGLGGAGGDGRACQQQPDQAS